MNENDKAKIPLAKPRPMFVRSSFLDADQLEDMLGLSTAVDDALNSLSAKGNESLSFFLTPAITLTVARSVALILRRAGR